MELIFCSDSDVWIALACAWDCKGRNVASCVFLPLQIFLHVSPAKERHDSALSFVSVYLENWISGSIMRIVGPSVPKRGILGLSQEIPQCCISLPWFPIRAGFSPLCQRGMHLQFPRVISSCIPPSCASHSTQISWSSNLGFHNLVTAANLSSFIVNNFDWLWVPALRTQLANLTAGNLEVHRTHRVSLFIQSSVCHADLI